ncbi:MAG: isochorismate synthase [Myxococcales bacterium]|nr:isochorismate synthase [Myxococcales bacterium]
MTIRARVVGALRRVGRLRPEGDLLAISLPIPPDSAAMAADFEPTFLWDARRAETLAPRLVAAFGEVAAAEAEGNDRIRAVEQRAREVLSSVTPVGSATPRLFGAVSFDHGRLEGFEPFGEARFFLPRVTALLESRAELVLVIRREELAHASDVADEVASYLGEGAPARAPFEKPRGHVVVDGRAAFERAVSRALVAIGEGAFEKVVLCRAVDVETTATAASISTELAQAAGCVRFCVQRGGAAFVGATPEVLVSVRGDEVRTEAVAGTEPRRGHELAETSRLLTRAKDLAEHRLVVEAIRSELERAGCEVAVQDTRVRTLTHVHHLVTPIIGKRAADTTVLGMAAALHPTPALGGSPRAPALDFIRQAEPFARGLFGGALGWIGPGGEGEMVVALRSALVRGARATAFAGCGIVAGSVPELEAQETDAKLGSMMRALGVSAAPKPGLVYREAGA